ncbi:unnamed protein product [Rhizoctonia solani]|uniref:Protein kinase domain-containing protein n=1 Tax=Rhizoctonia solani TaxID=456999 RepID=A0A8H2XRF3_9AGAM|nr:unnamed protein product [Rhizoctonia solani]
MLLGYDARSSQPLGTLRHYPEANTMMRYVYYDFSFIYSGDFKAPPGQVAVSAKSATYLIDQALHDVVTSEMTCIDIVTILTSHGCADLTSALDESACSKYPIANGGFGDVFHGQLVDGMAVAIKTIRAYYDQDQMARMYHKRAAKEIYTWSKCKHPNVVELIGSAVFHDCLAMISRWEENGNLLNYLSNHPSADRCVLSTSICAGLAYLHENDIVHGDLKGANILIAADGRPMLMDFGNASLLGATLQFTQTNKGPSFSLRWTAPEILQGTSSHTVEADVYSLGMTILEVFTSKIPFADKSHKSLVAHIVLSKRTPTRPETIIPSRSINGNTLWDILTRCWALDPKDRPSARVVWDKMKPITPETLKELKAEQ